MGRVRPGRRQVSVLHLEPKRAGATLANGFLALVALGVVVAALLYRTDAWPLEWRFEPEVSEQTPLIVAAVAACLALLFLASAIVNGRRWHIASAVERLSTDPKMASLLPDRESAPRRQRADIVPPLDVSVLKPRNLPKVRAKLRRVTPQHNVIGQRPLRIAYLRLFENQPRIRTFMEGPWREFGYVFLLRSATSVTPAEYKLAKKSGNPARMFISSVDQLLPALAEDGVKPKGRYRLKAIGPSTIKVRDRYGSYGVHALLCHGLFWKSAIDVLLDRVDLVALDLSGFRPENRGTDYELQRVIDRFPIERVVFLADPRTNKKFITEYLQTTWSEMALGSPNARAERKTAVVVVTDTIARRQSTQTHQVRGASGQPAMQQQHVTQVQVRLVARRRQTRRVVAMAQLRLNDWLAVRRA